MTKKTLRYLLKPLSLLPALCMMYVIFTFSSHTGKESASLSYQVSKTIILAYNKVFDKGYSNETLNQLITLIHPLVRKSAHFTEYFVLAVTVALPLYVYRIRGIFLFFTGGIFCVLFALLDEYHQSFVSGRGASLKDVGIDSLGVLFGILFAQLICFLGKKTIFHWLSMEEYRKKKKKYEQKVYTNKKLMEEDI